jgi:hypothetical protein
VTKTQEIMTRTPCRYAVCLMMKTDKVSEQVCTGMHLSRPSYP